MQTTTTTWEDTFKTALTSAATKAGIDTADLKWERCTTDSTWGDRCGLVFFGASPEVCERAARYFEAWARKHLRAMKVVGGYGSQESIGYVGEMYFVRYENGANGWYVNRPSMAKVDFEAGTVTTDYGHVTRPVEMRRGIAVSYIYYPCAY